MADFKPELAPNGGMLSLALIQHLKKLKVLIATKERRFLVSSLEIFDVAQGSNEWLKCRLGLVTASTASDMLAKQRDPAKDGMRKKLLYRLAAEILTGEPTETYRNGDMDRGTREEPEARALYDMISPIATTQVGFGVNDRLGCSPDSLVGEDGGLEIKSLRADLLIQAHEQGGKSQVAEHYSQVQTGMAVFGRQWWDLFLFHPKIKPLKIRIERDAAWISSLRVELKSFYADLDRIVAKHR